MPLEGRLSSSSLLGDGPSPDGRGKKEVDYAIVGLGLAGATLAWQLRRRGLRVLAFDRETAFSASRIATGLMTPVTGKRLARSWRFDELYPAAEKFYRAVEEQTGSRLLFPGPAVRLFRDETEQQEYGRREYTVLAGLVRPLSHQVDSAAFNAPHGGFEMPLAARLDVPRYLEVTRESLLRDNSYLQADLDLPSDVSVSPAGVCLPRFATSCRGIVLCRGHEAIGDPWFGVRFNAAKGEVLALRIAGLNEARVIHRGVWLAPVGGDLYRAGSTYVWDELTPHPTTAGRNSIESRLREFLKLPYEVIDHHAAVRPVIDAGYPALGIHPDFPRLAYFNGLGSKGSLLAPFFAEELARCLEEGRQPGPEVDVRRVMGR